jgi:Zn-dependent peptidase ImmA (M78 family)
MASPIKAEAARDASRLLKQAWSGVLPVDPVRIARKAGLVVVDAALDENTMGALIKKPGQDPVIMINEADGLNRRRFTCAHEIGHYVRRTDEAEEYTTVDLRSGLSASGTDTDEIYANEFAASLLMPEHEVVRLVAEGLADWDMAIRFVVSREAMQFRLKNLNDGF